jgi:hypothetical protein
MGEIYNITYNVDHRWRYLPNMAPDEVLVFKSYDSAEDGHARFTSIRLLPIRRRSPEHHPEKASRHGCSSSLPQIRIDPDLFFTPKEFPERTLILP